MKQLLITIVAVVLVGCGESQQSAPAPEVKLVEPSEPVAEAAKPKPPTAKAPDISIHRAAMNGNIEAVKRHLADGADVNAKNDFGSTPLIAAALEGHKEIVELLIAKGADVDAMNEAEVTSLHYAALRGHKEITKLLLAKGADVNAKDFQSKSPLDYANAIQKYDSPEVEAPIKEIATIIEIDDLLRKHGGKRGEELKAEGK